MGPCTTKQHPSKPFKASTSRPAPKPLPFRLLELLNSLSSFHIQQLYLRYRMHAPGRGLLPDLFPRVFPHALHLSDRLRAAVFSALDLDQDGVISFTEMCVAAVVGRLCDVPQVQAYLFKILDLKGDRVVDREELAAVLGTALLVLKSRNINALEDSEQAQKAIPDAGMNFDQFKQWANTYLNLAETSQFLRILSTPQEESDEFVRRFEAHLDLVEGETWFLVSSKWIRRWGRYCSLELLQIFPYVETVVKTTDEGSPFPIDNSDLEDPEHPQNLKESARQGPDFCIVHEEVWKYLVSTYGGGPAFPRKVVITDGKLVLSLFPAVVKIFRLQGDSYNKRKPGELMLPLTWTLKRLKTELKEVFPQLVEPFGLLLFEHACWMQVSEALSLEECAAAGGSLRFLCIPGSSDFFGNDQLEVIKEDTRCKNSPIRRVKLKEQAAEPEATHLRGVTILLMSEEEIQHSTQGLLPLPPDEELKGFPNINNTCYLNVVLEVLAHTPLLAEYVRAQGFLTRLDIKKTAFLIQLMSVLFRQMRKKDELAPDTEQFLLLLGEKVATFEYSAEQHDSYECLNAVLDVLHSELKTGPSQTLIKEATSPTKPQESAICHEIYSEMRSSGSSYISTLFSNVIKSEIFCDSCGFKKVTVNGGMSVYLPVPVTNIVHLRVSVLYLQGEMLHLGLEADLRHTVLQVLEKISVIAGLNRAAMKLITFREKNSFAIHLLATKVQDIVETIHGTIFAVECRTYQSLEQRADHPPPPDAPTDQPKSTATTVDLVSVKVIHKFVYRTKNRTSGVLPSAVSIPKVITYSEVVNALRAYARRLNGDEKECFILQLLDFRNYRCCLCVNPHCKGCPLPSTDVLVDWENMKGKAPAFVINWFEGEFKLNGRFHESYDTVEETRKKGFQLAECLSLYSEAKGSEAKCQRCGSELKTKEQLVYPADIVFICLERFTRYHGRLYKNKHFVRFPVSGLDLTPWLDLDLFPLRPDLLLYDLYAVVNHEGSASSGHNTAYCKSSPREHWLYCDDSRIFEVTGEAEDRVVTSDAYILCYRRRNLTGRSIVELTV